MPQPTGAYYGDELAIFNKPGAPSIAALTGPERQRLVKAIGDGVWASATMHEQSIMLKRHPEMAKAMQWQHQESLITPAGAFVSELLEETRDSRIERQARESVESARAMLRELGYPASLSEARQDPAALLALTSGQNLTAKMLLTKLPESQEMGSLASNYQEHLLRLKGDAEAALRKANEQLEKIAQRSAEINGLLNQQLPTDDDASGAPVPV